MPIASNRCTTSPKAIASQQDGPGGVAIDATHAYWTNQNGGQVMAVALDGGVPKLLADKQHPFGIAVDATHVYWANNLSRKSGSVMRVAKSAGAADTIAAAQGTPYSPGFANGELYWVTAEDGGVVKAALDGSGRKLLASGQGAPVSLGINKTGVYWLHTFGIPPPPSDTGDFVRRPPPDDFKRRPPGPPPRPDYSVEVRTMPLAGGTPKRLATDRGNPQSVVADDRRVYWTNPIRGVVMTVPIGGGPATALVTGERYPMALAIDDTHVYWIDHGRPDPDRETSSPRARIRKVALGGGAPVTLADIDGAVGIAVDAKCVYWTEARGTTGTVMTIAK